MQRAPALILAAAAAAACGDAGGGEPSWQRLAEHRPSALLGVWAGGETAWIVGGSEGAGLPPVVFELAGGAWTRHDPGVTDVDLWQVFGLPDGSVLLGGSGGTLIRRTPGGAFEKLATPNPNAIVFGLWGTSSGDAWAVGAAAGGGFVWRIEGTLVSPVAGLPSELSIAPVWKVTGRAADDVWMSCSHGLVLHWDGQQITADRAGAMQDTLFSIGCSATRCVAAGTNTSNGVLYVSDGSTWASRVPTLDGPIWRGVTPVGEDRYVVGMYGVVLHDEGDRFTQDLHGLTTRTLHAAWADADGLFAVGGDFDTSPTLEGVALYKGTRPLPPLP